MRRADVFDLIDQERRRQHILFGGPHRWGEGDCSSASVDVFVKAAVLVEEVGEACRALLDGGDPTDELVQVAAVAVAIIEGSA